MTSDLITVIVPIFNAGAYLTQCIESITCQSYEHLDILLLNDGSTDMSAEICESFREKDNRVRVVHRSLGGSSVGSVRNHALSMVKGKYIVFVDHDDWLDKNHIQELYQALKETSSDISIVNFTEYSEERGSFLFHLTKEDNFRALYTPEEWFKKEYDTQFAFSQCFTVPWGKLYKTELFDNIVYPTHTRVEDDYTTWKLYLLADKIVYQNRGSYFHRKHSESVTRKVSPSSVFPLKSIEERVMILSLVGFDVEQELRAYRWRLGIHREEALKNGDMINYKKCSYTLELLNKWKI